MEDYDVFVQLCASQLRKNKEENEEDSRPASSVIRFYGRPILPPLLSGKQRDEMRRHREQIQKHKQIRDDPRMVYVQTLLHSVQLRKTPTLEELFQESAFTPESSHPRITDGVSVSHHDVLASSLGRLKNSSVVLPESSITHSALFSSDVSPRQSYHEGCLSDQLYSQQDSQPCSFSGEGLQSPSSGYVTYENPKSVSSISGRIDSGTERCGFGSSGDMGSLFLQNTSNTVAKMPDIINHPPVDGEELERSQLESFVSSDCLGVKDACDASFNYNLATHDPSEMRDPNHVDHEEIIPFTTKINSAVSINVSKSEGLVALTEKNCPSGNTDRLSDPHCPTPEPHAQKTLNEAEPELVDNQIDKTETRQPVEPHPMSLQALLKKSQEYRRRQRMLRNQAKNTKIQERTQEQPKTQTEEQNLSDKENNHNDTVTVEGKKTKERRGTFTSLLEKKMSKVPGEKTNIETESTNVTQDENTKQLMSVQEETTLKNKLNSSRESTQSCELIQQWPTTAETNLLQDPSDETTSLGSFQKKVGKYCTVPVPNFCQSPVRFKSEESPNNGSNVEETGTLVGSSDFNELKVKKVSQDHENSHTALLSTVNLMIEDDVTNVFAKSSLHIDQLESNLSSLKVLISDLESTVKENLDSQGQTEGNVQTEPSLKTRNYSELTNKDQHVKPAQRENSGCLENKQVGDDGGSIIDDRELENSQLFINLSEDLEPESSLININDFHLTVDERGPGIVKLSQQRLCKTKGPKNLKSNTQHASSTTQQLPAKYLTSVAQWMRIPNMFQDVPCEHFPLSVLFDQSNHPELRERAITAEGQSSVHSPSLNQSYDVETPSGLWFLEGSGSDLGSQSREKYLTPESGAEEQEVVSKVKRRLLMNGTEGTQERSAGSGVRSNSSTPRAAVRWHDDIQRDKHEHLKQVHAAQVRALQDKHRQQQEELLQVLAARFRLLQSASPRSVSGSCPGDTLTFSTLSQPRSPHSQHYSPLLAAAMKGFLTRRLLRTERVAQLVRTIRDMQQFLQAFQPQRPGRGDFGSRQDALLQERVALQLRAARYEVYDIFFSLSARERMQLISWDRELVKERQLRRQNEDENPRRKSFLSAATQKSLERRREIMIQKKAAEQHRGVLTKTGQKSRFTSEKPQETKRGQFKANPQRVPKSSCSSRPR